MQETAEPKQSESESLSEGLAAESAPKEAVELVQDMPVAVYMLAGADYHVALCEDGTVWNWGSNGDGKLGLAVETLSQPERIPELENVIKLVDGGKDIFACDEADRFWYEGEYCSLEEWFARTKQYILLTKDGRTRVRNSVAWTVFGEEK